MRAKTAAIDADGSCSALVSIFGEMLQKAGENPA
jgi:hypothetical protein